MVKNNNKLGLYVKKTTFLLLSMLLTFSIACGDERPARSKCSEQQFSTEISTEERTEIDTTEATESATEPLKLFQFDESNIPVLDENDYAIDDKTLITDELIVYKPIVNTKISFVNSIFNDIYSEIAKKYSVSVMSIDHSIKKSIVEAWYSDKLNKAHMLFKCSYIKHDCPPINSEFIATMAELTKFRNV